MNETNYISNDQTISTHNFRCDSLKVKNRILNVFVTDDLDFFDPVQAKQKSLYALSVIEYDSSVVDSVRIYFEMPNRESGNQRVVVAKDEFELARMTYNNPSISRIMKFILKADSIVPSNNYLGGINIEFAFFIYGDETLDIAFFGVDALEVIKDYLVDCKEDRYGYSLPVLEKYKQKMMSYKENVKQLSQSLVKLIEKECAVNKN